MSNRLVASLLLAAFSPGAGWTQDAPPVPKEGLAALYPGDAGLDRDPRVLFVEDFETAPKTVGWMQPDGWFAGVKFEPGSGMEVTDQVPAAGGKRCLQYNLKAGQKSSGGMFRLLKPGERVHLRYYRKFEKAWDWPKGYGPHDTGLYGYAGDFKAPTDTEIHVLLDFTQNADTFVGIGTPRQQVKDWSPILKKTVGTHAGSGTGLAWNRARPDKIEPGKWHCVEMMVQLSRPGQSDGAIRLWVNGKLVSEADALPLRDADHADLKLNLLLLAPYFHPGSPRDQTHWVDQVVAATDYIGPIHPVSGK